LSNLTYLLVELPHAVIAKRMSCNALKISDFLAPRCFSVPTMRESSSLHYER
jgi:hypothetical protein